MRDPWDEFEEPPGEEGVLGEGFGEGFEEGFEGAAWGAVSWAGDDTFVAVYDEHGNPVWLAPVESAGFAEETFWGPDDPEGWDEPDDEPDEGPDAGPGGAGVREPRRPRPGPPSTAAEADPDEAT